jgi:hypothetical protein
LLINSTLYLKGENLLNKLYLLIFMSLSCNSPHNNKSFEGQDVLQEFQTIYPPLNLIDSSWELSFIFNDEDMVQFEAYKQDSSLLFNFVKLTKIKQENPGHPFPTISFCYGMDQILYNWEDDKKDTYIYFNEKLDTLYHFYWENGTSWTKDPIFIRGKYAYLYYNNRLTRLQMDYYKQFSDSLIRVAGNELVDLPELIE